MDGFLKYFPKKPYEHQIDVMRKIEEALKEERIVLFEGACGTGKTIVSLATALSVAEDTGKKVLVATNVHQQMLQFVEELREIRRKVGNLKVTVLKGKTHLCPERRSYEECEKLIEKEKCERYSRISQTKIESFVKWYFSDVRFPEEVMEKEGDCCPYELLKRCMSLSDVIVCNYHHILNPEIFMRLLNWCSCDVRDFIVIFDEAHNLESSAREHSSIFLREEVVKGAIREAEEMGREEFAELLRNLNSAILEIIEERRANLQADEELFLDGGDELFRRIEESFPNYFEAVEEMYEVSFEGAENLRNFSDFMITWRYFSGDPSYAFVIRVNQREEYTLEIFSCIPKKVTKPLFDSVSAAILMSATLRPFEVLREVLGIERETTELVVPSPFPKERRLTLVVRTPPLFQKRREDERIVRGLKNILRDIIRSTPGNVLIFFPSYQDAEKYYRMMDVEGKLLDRVGEPSDEVRRRFFEAGERGRKAVLFSYLWGTLAEGVDYRDGRARSVVIVGVGYPSLNERIAAIKRAYDAYFGNGFEYAIQIPTIRRIRQCMGRVVRSPEDYGARILIDVRFSQTARRTLPKYEVYSKFPEDERREFVEISPEEVAEKLSKFFSGFLHPASEFRRLI